MRQVPLLAIIFEALLGCFVLYFYLKILRTALFDAPARPLVWFGLTFFGLIVLMFSCAIMGATSLARERESGTWETLSVTLLKPHQIIIGKFGAALFACAVFSLPFLPLMLPCIAWTGKPVAGDMFSVQLNPLLALCTSVVVADAADHLRDPVDALDAVPHSGRGTHRARYRQCHGQKCHFPSPRILESGDCAGAVDQPFHLSQRSNESRHHLRLRSDGHTDYFRVVDCDASIDAAGYGGVRPGRLWGAAGGCGTLIAVGLDW
jgi:hypothetical protein